MAPDHRSDTPTDAIPMTAPDAATEPRQASSGANRPDPLDLSVPFVPEGDDGGEVDSGEVDSGAVDGDGADDGVNGDDAPPAADMPVPADGADAPPGTGSDPEPEHVDARDEIGRLSVAVPAAPATAWRALARGLRPTVSRGQVLAALLCALLGFALVVQVRQTRVEGLSSLRQSDLVRILDESTQRSEQLQREATTLEQTRRDLLSGSDRQQAALEAATQRAATQGILSGRLPAHGPGIEITLTEQSGPIPAMDLLNVLEELRNAGAEAVQLGDLRLTASSYFADSNDGVVVDGVTIGAPYHWVAIGDPETMAPALDIAGGAMATIRHDGGRGTISRHADVEITAVRAITAPLYATPSAGPAS